MSSDQDVKISNLTKPKVEIKVRSQEEIRKAAIEQFSMEFSICKEGGDAIACKFHDSLSVIGLSELQRMKSDPDYLTDAVLS